MRQRLPAEDRRRQLVGIGLMMLRNRPIHELSIDAVAEEAGISRGLLFHYFPTKRDFYIAVISAAGRRLLRVTKPDPTLPPDEQLRQMLLAFVAFVSRRRDSYISFVRGAAGGDNYVVEVYSETRAGLTARVLDLLGESAADPTGLPGATDGPRLAGLRGGPGDRMVRPARRRSPVDRRRTSRPLHRRVDGPRGPSTEGESGSAVGAVAHPAAWLSLVVRLSRGLLVLWLVRCAGLRVRGGPVGG